MASKNADLDAVVSRMSLTELQELNRKVVSRIRVIHADRDRAALARFKVGDLVEFVDEAARKKVRARVSRINAKSLVCNELGGLQIPWRVPPASCRLVGG